MRRININRKTLSFILCFTLVSVFSLTIAYAALSVTLNIVGNAEVVASNWNIYLSNPKVKNGSATTAVPTISGNTLSFNTTLKTPGDYYEFTVDVVNNGTIDAMIDSVTKTPELTSEQAKYLKYEITYQNGESINSKQILSTKTTMPIKVRIEYRKDLVASDLPSSNSTLTFTITLNYVQSDGTGSSVENNGFNILKVVSGSGTNIGNEVCIKNECFYVISSDDTSVTMLAKYNLHVGYSLDINGRFENLSNPTGIQDETAKGYDDVYPLIGTVPFSNYGINYSGSIVEYYINNYNSYLITQGVTPIEARLITKSELIALGCSEEHLTCNSAPSWVYSTTYWTMTAGGSDSLWNVNSYSAFEGEDHYGNDDYFGVRPVIVISRSLITDVNGPTKIIDFSLDGVNYQAEEGMTWMQWVHSKYNTNGFVLYNYCLYSSSGNIVCNEYSSSIIVDNKEYKTSVMCE